MKIIKILLLLTLSFNLSYGECKSELFNIGIKEPLSAYNILEQLAIECSFSILIKDSTAKELLKSSIESMHFQNVTIYELFDYLIKERNLNYTFSKDLLKIRYLTTQTFKIDYITGNRVGSSNAGVSLGTGTKINSSSSDSSTNNSNSGTEIISNYKFNFWERLKEDINFILSSSSNLANQKLYDLNINEGAGLITVKGSFEQIREVGNYIKKLKNRIEKQVLIDVKILTVELNDEQKTGIDWNNFLSKLAIQYTKSRSNTETQFSDLSSNLDTEVGIDGDSSKTLSNSLSSGIGDILEYGSGVLLSFSKGSEGDESSNYGSVQVTDIINILKEDGDVESLSNPKVLAMNNQPAFISSGTDIYYKTTSVVNTTSSNSGTVESNENIGSIFAGVLLDITPSITDNREIILKINPSSSDVSGTIPTDRPPNLTRQQISTVIRAKDGDKIILGGLINTKNSTNERKIPILGDLPILGNLFKSVNNSKKLTELVIIITPRIVKRNSNLSLKDLEYRKLN